MFKNIQDASEKVLIFKSTETEGWKIILFSLFVKDKNTYWDFYCLLLPTNGHLYLVLWAAHTFLSTNFGIQLCSPTWKLTPSSHSHQQWAGSPFWAQNRGLNFDPIILVLKPRWLANRISPSLKPLKVHEDPETGSQKEALPGTSTEVVRQGCHMLFPDASKTESSKKSRAPCHGMSHVKESPPQRSVRRNYGYSHCRSDSLPCCSYNLPEPQCPCL